MPRAQDDGALRRAQDDDLVMNLVELALSQPAEAREAYLRTACDGDAELFSQVWDYVQWNHRMQGFLLEPLYPALHEHQFQPGELLADRFRIVRELGQGGMGVVYEAEDKRLGSRIALKCAKSGFRKRLPPEVRHAREISHPHVCRIFEIHTASAGDGEIDFLTMEYLEGETLAARLSRGPLPDAEARAIARQICAGLAEAHRNHVVHGDLKSNNVILARETAGRDGAGRDTSGGVRAVITDFGLARKPLGPMEDVATSATGSSRVGGTPDYMAPELWKGEKPSAASDVYALGVILYEMVASRRPYARETPWQDRLIHQPPPVRHGWDSILQRCLDPDPAKRFRDAGEVAAALEPPRSRRWWMAAAAAAVLAAAVSGVVTYQRATAPKESWRLAMLPIESSADTAALAGDLSRDVAGQLRRLKGGSSARLTFVDASQIAGGALQATHKLRATLTQEGDKLLLHAVLTDARSGVNIKDWTATYAPAEVRRYAPVALAGMVTGTLRLPPLAVAAVNPAAVRDYWAGVWYTRQNSTLDGALRTLKQAVAEDPGSPLTLAALAEAQWFEYYLTKDQAWLNSTRESLREAEGRNPDVPAAHRVEGYLNWASGRYEQAVPEFERAIGLQPSNAMAHIWLGKAYEDNAQVDKALMEFQKAREVEPGYFRTWQNLAAFYLQRGHFSEGAQYHKKAVDLAPTEPNLHWNLALAYMDLGRFDETRQEIMGLETVPALTTFGMTLMYQGMYREAVLYLERALNLGSPVSGVRKYSPLMYLGIAYRRLNMLDEAKEMNQRGLAMADAEMAQAGNARDGYVEAFQGYFSAALGDPRAETQIQQALGLMPDDSDTRWRAVLAYEELFRRSGKPAFRDKTLEVLRGDTAEQVADVNRWQDLVELRRDLRFQELLARLQIRQGE
ncbi:MAG TPA: protein kinase [Bryobacteraceae bacterium]|nr:protein kinase [Bryobacteraceae bacterium]